MTRFPLTGRYSGLCVLLTLFWLSGQSLPVRAEKIYNPVPLILN
ncbi:MAG: peptidase, partial [Microcystis sp.]